MEERGVGWLLRRRYLFRAIIILLLLFISHSEISLLCLPSRLCVGGLSIGIKQRFRELPCTLSILGGSQCQPNSPAFSDRR